MTARWTARFALLALFVLFATVTGCAPESVPASSPTTAKARTPLVVIPASAKTYSNRGVVAWKVYPYLSGKVGGFTIVGVDSTSTVQRVTRVFDIAGAVKGAPARLAYAPLFPKAEGRTWLGATGLIASSMGSSTNARHISDVLADAQAYLPTASAQGSSCSTSVKRVLGCMTAPSVGDLGSRWTQVRACRLAMAHLVQPTTCIQHPLKLTVPSAALKTKDGDDDDATNTGDDDDDTTNNSTQTDAQQDAQQDNQDTQDQQQDAQQDSTDNTQGATNAGDFTPGTDDSTNADNTPAATPAADDQPTDSNGLASTEATQAQGVDPLPTAGETQTAQDGTADNTQPSGDCGGGTSTESIHVLTGNVCTAPAAAASSTPVPTADQGSFGAPDSQATCSSGCAATQAPGSVSTNQAQVAVPTTGGLTTQASVSLGTVNVNASLTEVASDPGFVYVSLGAGATTQLASASVGVGPIAVRGDPSAVLTGYSAVGDVGGGVGIVGGQIEVSKNASGSTIALTGQLGPSLIPASVGSGVSYGWRVALPEVDPSCTLCNTMD